MNVCGNLILAKKTAVANAVKIGELLIRIRASRQGEWLDWLRCNVKFSHDTALRYIACFEQRDELAAAKISSLSDAYTLLLPPVSRSKSTKALRSVRNDSLGTVVKEYVLKGIAADEKAARKLLRKRAEEGKEAEGAETVEEPKRDSKPDFAPEDKTPKGWTPPPLEESDLTDKERGVVRCIREHLASTPKGRREVFLRYLRETLECGT
jgi:hypothetical protein